MLISTEVRESIATICLMAAFADGNKESEEAERLKIVFQNLGMEFSSALYSRILLGQVQLDEVARVIDTPEQRELAYEMALGICDADGQMVPAERDFLGRLRVALSLDADATNRLNEEGEALAGMGLDAPDPTMNSLPTLHQDPGSTPPPGNGTLNSDPSLDPMILKYAVLNGGLELLPQSLASMAIVPLQMKMVYRVGERFGYQLDQGHIRELLAVVGVGMTSQVLEGYARKLVGGFMKKAIGKKGKKKKAGKKMAKAAGVATGAAMSFASTYALGQVAKTYYAGGRKLSPDALKQVFTQQVEQGKQLSGTYREQIEASARNTDLSSLLNMVRGSKVGI